MALTSEQALQDFADALITNWTTDTGDLYSGDENNPGIADMFDALIISKGTRVPADNLPSGDTESLRTWVSGREDLAAVYAALPPADKALFDAYMPTALAVREIKDAAEREAGVAAVAYVAAPINAAEGDRAVLDSLDVRSLITESLAVRAPLEIPGAETQVAAWQEAMNAYVSEHGGKHVTVDGAWGKGTQALYDSLGGDAQEVIAKLRSDSISLHPEHFEVVVPGVPSDLAANGPQK